MVCLVGPHWDSLFGFLQIFLQSVLSGYFNVGLSTSAFLQLGLLDFYYFSVGDYAYRSGRLTVWAGRPEGWNDGKGKDDGVKFLTGAVGVMVFEVFAGLDDAGGQAKDTRRRRGAMVSGTGCGAAGGRPRLSGTAAVVSSRVWQAFKR